MRTPSSYFSGPQSLGRSPITLALAVLIICAISTVALTFFLYRGLVYNRTRALETEQVLTNARDFLSAVQDAEIGQRGFLITRQEAYLHPFREGFTDAARLIGELKAASINKPAQLALVRGIEELWQRKLAELDDTIEVARTKGFETAQSIIMRDAGTPHLMDLRERIGRFIELETQRRNEALSDTHRHVLLLFGAVSVGNLIGLAGLFWLLRSARQLNAQLQEEIDLRLSAEELAEERRSQATRVRVLNRELAHRTKNLISVVQAIVRNQAKGGMKIADYADALSNRLTSLASTMDILIRDDWTETQLKDLLIGQTAHFEEEIGRRIVINDGPKVIFTPSEAQMMGLALHELGTNAAKYGALSAPKGKVTISWSATPEPDGSLVVELKWVEADGPAALAPSQRGFGSRLIDGLVSRAVNGRAELSYDADGFKWTLTFPRKAKLDHEHHADDFPG